MDDFNLMKNSSTYFFFVLSLKHRAKTILILKPRRHVGLTILKSSFDQNMIQT
jgi:hypothetical protein